MGLSAHIPLLRFIKIARKSGGIDGSKLHHLSPWLLKLILFEPFRIIESLLFNKKIKQYQIENDPVFILGFYRSGTTYLQRLFSQNNKLGYQTVFHSALPELMLGFEWLFKPFLSLIVRLFHIRNDFHKIPFTWDFPGEEDVALTGFSIDASPNWGNLFPRSFLNYYEDYAWSSSGKPSSERWKESYLFWLKKLSLKNKGKRLVLKSPPNTARIEILLELFPNAKFVCIHRNPLHVYISCRRFWEIINKHYALQKISSEEISKLTLESFNRTMNLYHSAKNKIPPGNLFELTHESLAEQPFNRFRELYIKMKLDDFGLIEEPIRRYTAQTSNYSFTHYKLTTEEQQQVEEHWSFHISYWESLRKQNL